MKSALAIETGKDLPESRRAALITLLADDDPEIYRSVRAKIISFGPQAAEWLRPYSLSPDPVLRRRANEVVIHFGRQTADNEFLSFCLKQGEKLDVEQGAWLLARTRYPDINVEAYRALLDIFAADLKERIASGTKSHSVLTTINHYLFDEKGFCGNEENYYDPENSYLNRVIDRRTGNPINLALTYLLIAQRLRLPMSGIGLPGHFVCRYQSASGEIFIDAFNRGRLLTKADCVAYLARSNYSLRDEYLSPVTPRRMLLRICHNLHQVHLQTENAEECTRFQRYLVALAR